MISVIVPVYNVEKYIIGCLKSIVSQDYKDFELILVNDGTKDSSIDLAQEYLKDKDVVWKIVNKENGGLASARNAGLSKAKGEYISFIDADDAVAKDFLSSMFKQMRDDTDFVFCNFQFTKKQEAPVDDNDEIRVFDKEKLLEAFLKRTIGFVVPSMLFKKSFLLNNDLFFDEKIRFSEDQPFIWDVILHSEKSVYLYKKLYGYYTREGSIMNNSSADKVLNSHQEFKEVIGRLFADSYPDIRNKVVPRWELGALYTSARMLKYEDYLKVYEQMGGKTIFQRIAGIGEIKAYLLAAVCSLSPKLLYELCRRMDLNG